MSHQTISRKVEDIACQIEEILKTKIEECKYFSVALDESVDINDISQLLIFCKTIDSEFTSHEELLKVIPMAKGCKGVN